MVDPGWSIDKTFVKNELPKGAVMFMEGFENDTSEEDIKKALIETSRWFSVGIYKSNYLL